MTVPATSQVPNLFPALDAATEAALRESIRRFGVLVPVVRDQHGRTLDGHHRSRIADELGAECRVDVVQVADDDQARDIAATLNTDRRQLTLEQRREVVASLREQGHSLRAIAGAAGVSKSQVDKDVRELSTSGHLEGPSEVVGRDGKHYPAQSAIVAAQKDRERKARSDAARAERRAEDETAEPLAANMMHGDCRALATALPPGSIRLVLTDPPYGANYRSGFRWASSHNEIRGDESEAHELFAEALAAILPALAADAHILVFCRWQTEPDFRRVLTDTACMTVRSSLVWVKNEHGMGDLRHSFGPAHERILHATRGDAAMRYREADVLTFPRVVSDRHPTEKPVDLLAKLIRATTDPGDLVVDPFAGVGSTLVAAASCGRQGWGCEIDETYHGHAVERLAA